MAIIDLKTKYTDVIEEIPWNDYPRPQLKRDSFLCLNGLWDFKIDKRKEIPKSFDMKIRVPFCVESTLSTISVRDMDKNSIFHYKRKFSSDDIKYVAGKDRVILHFGAVDQECTVLLNGREIIHHMGGYLPFSAEITDYLLKTNTLNVTCIDTLSHTYPWGKQKRNRGGMWYTPVSGIWQTVWIEVVPSEYVQGIKVKTKGPKVSIKVEGINKGTIQLEKKKYVINNGLCEFEVENPNYWSPENPHLYRYVIKAGNDKVESYFALRDISIEEINGIKRICLNGKPYFFNGLLDQGYWPDGLYTPPSPKCYEEDILNMKSLGYNTLRKHIKIEPEKFYYDCDRLGMVVFQDMVNNGEYSFIIDGVFPNLFPNLKLSDKILMKNIKGKEVFIESMKETVSLLYNHPSICYWTIFNECWGQFDADKLYDMLKEQDDTRIVDSTSGWHQQIKSDVHSLHIYFKKIHISYNDRPVILSEFGGYSYKIMDHSANLNNTYGYKKYTEKEEFLANYISLYEEEILEAKKAGLSGAIYTQVSDVEDETNGLLTYDREILKIYPEEIRELMKRVCEEKE